MRISDWSSDVCSSDLLADGGVELHRHRLQVRQIRVENLAVEDEADIAQCRFGQAETGFALDGHGGGDRDGRSRLAVDPEVEADRRQFLERYIRSEEHTSELQSLMRISYAVFCLKKKKSHAIISLI